MVLDAYADHSSWREGLLFIKRSGEYMPVRLTELIPDRGHYRARFEGVMDRTSAEKLTGLELWIEGELKQQHPWSDLVGMRAHDRRLGEIGVIEEVLEYPGQFLARVIREGQEVLVPLNSQLIVKQSAAEIWFDLPEGLVGL